MRDVIERALTMRIRIQPDASLLCYVTDYDGLIVEHQPIVCTPEVMQALAGTLRPVTD
jgi:hypothetical protein